MGIACNAFGLSPEEEKALFQGLEVLKKIDQALPFQPQKMTFGSIQIETGSSTEDILPLLTKISEEQGTYCKRIYGQHRTGYALVFYNSNGKVPGVNKLEQLGQKIVRMMIDAFPEGEGRIEIVPEETDFWDSFQINFDKGNIISTKLSPDMESIQLRLDLKKYTPKQNYKKNDICDITSAIVYGLQLGDIKDQAEIIDAIGLLPSSSSLGLTFSQKGVEVILQKSSDKSKIISFKIWYSADDPSGTYNTKFEGVYAPSLTANENIESIKQKFGNPIQIKTNFFDNQRYFYEMQYGGLIFDFDSQSSLNMITMSIK